MPAAENTNNFWNLGEENRGDGGCLADTGLFLRRFLQHGVGRVIGWVGAPIFFHSQPDQNCQHNEANDPFFLSCENEH